MTLESNLNTLNKEQREAVICEDKRILVLAGAGSGKTKTLLQKIQYLLEEKSVNASSILAITYTKNAANEMIDRLIMEADTSRAYEKIVHSKKIKKSEKNLKRIEYIRKFKWLNSLTIKTFHSFCYNAMRNYGVVQFDNKFRIIGEEKAKEDDEFSKYLAGETTFEVFHRILIELCENSEYLADLKRYILDYLVDRIHTPKYINRMQNHQGLNYRSLKGTMVRSKSEQYIADWLFRHNINYVYEPKVNFKDFDFHPDFYIQDANLYLEHVSNLSAPMQAKEKQFEEGNILYVKTYEVMTKDSVLFNLALERIVKNRLPANFKQSTALSYIEEFRQYHKNVRTFIEMVSRVLDMIKIENSDIEKIFKEGASDQHERVRNFYILAKPLCQKYLDYCINKSYLDFNDLISRAIRLFGENSDIRNKFQEQYKYILVDEFQDVNNLQVDLINLLLTSKTQLFCVGDDWQSIYGFRGSNVSYIIDFEKHFHPATLIKLNLNYRSTDNIVNASNEVIKHNKFKIEKDIISTKFSEQKIVVFAGNNENENMAYCQNEIQKLIQKGLLKEDILVLYRRTKMYTPYKDMFERNKTYIQSKTIHAAKGLEAKVVFIIGLTEGTGGFPDIWMEDRIFQIIRKSEYDLLMEEERRLFYVALTRAKDNLYLITEKGNESPFIKEIPATYTVKTFTENENSKPSMAICSSCSNQLDNLFKFCPYCGQTIVTDTESLP